MLFKYHRNWMKGYLGFLLGALFLGTILWPIWAKPQDWVSLEIEFSVPIFLFFVFLSANYYLATSDIDISDHGVSWILRGWRWKEIRWLDLSRIRILSTWDFQNKRWMKMLSLDQENRSRLYFRKKGSIFFSEKIVHFDELVRLIRERAKQHSIPVVNQELPE